MLLCTCLGGLKRVLLVLKITKLIKKIDSRFNVTWLSTKVSWFYLNGAWGP